jgi:predicted Zn-dependent protease
MIGKDKVLTLLKEAVTASGCDQVEMLLVARDSGCTRFANSVVHQNVHEEKISVYIRVLEEGKVGLTRVPSLERDLLRRGLEKARDAGRMAAAEKDFVSFPEPQTYTKVQAYSSETAEFDHNRRVECLKGVFAEAAERDLQMAGAFTTGVEEIAIVNCNGVEAYQLSSYYDSGFTALADKSSGFSGGIGTDIGVLDPCTLARGAIDKALVGGDAVELEPGKYTVILEPKALAELLEWTAYIAFGAKAYQDGISFMKDKIGEKIVGENITIYDDSLEPVGLPRMFDYEGVAKRRNEIFKDGKAVGVAYDTIHGLREGKESTGNATIPYSDDGPVPLNLSMAGGDNTLDEIIASSEKAVLITRFHYVNGLLNPEIALMTGMTRDGTFLVEDGAVTRRVEDMRFTDSVLRILNNVTAISRERQSIKAWWSDEGAFTIPVIRVEDLVFTGKTG